MLGTLTTENDSDPYPGLGRVTAIRGNLRMIAAWPWGGFAFDGADLRALPGFARLDRVSGRPKYNDCKRVRQHPGTRRSG